MSREAEARLATTSERGFRYMDPVPSDYGGYVSVSESSAVEPHIWLRVECPVNLNEPGGPTRDAVAHLSIENARRLRDQLNGLLLEDRDYE